MLISCHECNSKISNQASSCPQCGAPTKNDLVSERKGSGKNSLLIAGVVCFFSFFVYAAYSDWNEKRAAKQKSAAEVVRRNSLTVEQRQAEESAKENERLRQAEILRQKKVKDEEMSFKGACRIALERTLFDPSSARIEDQYGSIQATGDYIGYIDGRAKNAFGALMPGRWKCPAIRSGENIIVNGIEQIKR